VITPIKMEQSAHRAAKQANAALTSAPIMPPTGGGAIGLGAIARG
jgi:hypothetical protein